MQNREGGNVLVIILGIVLVLFLVGFFRSNRAFWDTLNFKQILRLPCGLTVQHPDPAKPTKLSFPLVIDGYVNGCGWDISKNTAGTAQIFDQSGMSVTAPTSLAVSADQKETPYYFSALLIPSAAPHTDKGNLIFTSTTGLIYGVSVAF